MAKKEPKYNQFGFLTEGGDEEPTIDSHKRTGQSLNEEKDLLLKPEEGASKEGDKPKNAWGRLKDWAGKP